MSEPLAYLNGRFLPRSEALLPIHDAGLVFLRQVVEDAKDVKNASTGTIQSAYDDLREAIETRPTDKPITEVIAGIQPKVTAFAKAWKDFANSLDCSNAS